MRQRTALALLSVLLTSGGLTGCIVPAHDNFATPQDTVLTFQSAFARDDEFKEYDCFSDGMRESQGLTQQRWSTARGLVFEPFGAIGRFVLRRNSLDDNLLGGAIDRQAAQLVYQLLGHRLEVELVPELVLLLPNPITGKVDVWTLAEPGVLAIDVSAALAERWEADGIAWAELRSQWKLNAIAASDDTLSVPLPLAAPPPERVTTMKVGRIKTTRLRQSLGVVRLLFALSLGAKDDDVDCLRWESEPATSR